MFLLHARPSVTPGPLHMLCPNPEDLRSSSPNTHTACPLASFRSMPKCYQCPNFTVKPLCTLCKIATPQHVCACTHAHTHAHTHTHVHCFLVSIGHLVQECQGNKRFQFKSQLGHKCSGTVGWTPVCLSGLFCPYLTDLICKVRASNQSFSKHPYVRYPAVPEHAT